MFAFLAFERYYENQSGLVIIKMAITIMKLKIIEIGIMVMKFIIIKMAIRIMKLIIIKMKKIIMKLFSVNYYCGQTNKETKI